MELEQFNIKNNFIFDLKFNDGFITTIDMANLLQNKVTLDELKTARIDKEWGCLEFKDGMVDIEPKTLYKYATKTDNK